MNEKCMPVKKKKCFPSRRVSHVDKYAIQITEEIMQTLCRHVFREDNIWDSAGNTQLWHACQTIAHLIKKNLPLHVHVCRLQYVI